MNVEIAGTWWIQSPREQWPDDPAFRAAVESLLQDQVYGDRRQELVFIGKEMNQAHVRELLDAALLTDEEMALGPEQWRAFPDPFPSIAELEEAATLPVHAHAEHEEGGKYHHHGH